MMRFSKPCFTDTQRTFGFGDRWGLAGAGHVQASYRCTFMGAFAQQYVDEIRGAMRTPSEVVIAARQALEKARYPNRWAANVDGIRSVDDIEWVKDAGFSLFTVDVSQEVFSDADDLSKDALASVCEGLANEGIINWEALCDRFLDKPFEVSELLVIQLGKEKLMRLAVKFARAIARADALMSALADRMPGKDTYEVELSLSASPSPTTAEEHMFVVELIKEKGHTITSFAPRMLTGWESVVDFRGTRQQVERFMKAHVAVAYYEGSYKVSIHHGDDKFSVLPSLGLICGNLLHFKISGTSFLEGMRVVVRKHPTLFNEIVAFCLENHGMRNYPIPCSLDREAIDELSRTTLKDVEGIFIDQEVGRQLLEGMYAPVFSIGRRPNGIPFKEALTEVIQKHEGLLTGFLTERVGRHVELLSTSA